MKRRISPRQAIRSLLGRSRVIQERASASLLATHKEPVPGPPRYDRFVVDSALEGNGFEPSVPRKIPGISVLSAFVRAAFALADIKRPRYDSLFRRCAHQRAAGAELGPKHQGAGAVPTRSGKYERT